MTSTNISQSKALKRPVDQIVTNAMVSSEKRDASSLNYERDCLRNLLLQGAQSDPTGLADKAYFASLRSGISSR